MAGYTPVFDSVYAGSLCGRWPTTAVWVTLLPLCDKHGHIDLSYQAICALTGWPMDLLQQGIAELMKPDHDSRSAEEEGRRLVLLDPNRQWGWRVVNHGLYREKARKLQYDNERTASGRDAERKRLSREVPRSPDASREVPLSDADADIKSKRGRALRSRRVPADFEPDREWAKSQIPDLDVEREVQKFRDWEFKTPRSDWPAVWRTWVGNCRENGRYAKKQEGTRRGLPVLNG